MLFAVFSSKFYSHPPVSYFPASAAASHQTWRFLSRLAQPAGISHIACIACSFTKSASVCTSSALSDFLFSKFRTCSSRFCSIYRNPVLCPCQSALSPNPLLPVPFPAGFSLLSPHFPLKSAVGIAGLSRWFPISNSSLLLYLSDWKSPAPVLLLLLSAFSSHIRKPTNAFHAFPFAAIPFGIVP